MGVYDISHEHTDIQRYGDTMKESICKRLEFGRASGSMTLE